MDKNLKNLFGIVVAAILIVAMQIVQSGSPVPSFKFWICFSVVVAALIYIVIASFALAKGLRMARKQVAKLNKQLSECEIKAKQDNKEPHQSIETEQ
ncbi:MAG: hypothetical protein LBL74_07595 [Bacteroidales bacterium]|jgi:hypothetical protein|nr:hypothetical protein [Bacteroidales bacterium]